MARTKRSAKLDTRNARMKLPAGKRFPDPLSIGRYLVYRRPISGAAGTWQACWVNPETKIQAREAIGTADDFQDADGNTILTYAQAQAKAISWFQHQERRALDDEPVHSGSFTVADAMDAYFTDAGRRGVRGLDRDILRAKAWILPPLGHYEVTKLTRKRLESWLEWVATSPRRLKTKIGQPQAYAPPPATDDEKRARKDSANRVLTPLKAALTFAVDRQLVHVIDPCWHKVKPYKGTTSARLRYLQPDEATRLANVCPTDFRDLVRGALLTGARYGELIVIPCKDYDPNGNVPTIFLAKTKNGKPRHVILNDEGVALFNQLTAKRNSPNDLIFMRRKIVSQARDTKGKFDNAKQEYELGAWGKNHQTRYMEVAYKAAGLEKITFHELRHTYATMLLNQGCPPVFVADQIGDELEMVLKHYGHICDLAKAAAVRAAMPTLGIVEPAKVKKLKIQGA